MSNTDFQFSTSAGNLDVTSGTIHVSRYPIAQLRSSGGTDRESISLEQDQEQFFTNVNGEKHWVWVKASGEIFHDITLTRANADTQTSPDTHSRSVRLTDLDASTFKVTTQGDEIVLTSETMVCSRLNPRTIAPSSTPEGGMEHVGVTKDVNLTPNEVTQVSTLMGCYIASAQE